MLIRFTLKNYASFLEEQSLSMVKGRVRSLKNHINSNEAGGFKTLKGAVIFGANASGKSNLIEAMLFAQDFIVHNRKNDKSRYFKLDENSSKSPSSFNFDFKINDKAFSYGFENKGKTVVEEWLYEISSTAQDKMIFHRHEKKKDIANIEFSSSFEKSLKKKELADLKSVVRTTPDDSLFLYDAYKRNIKYFLEPLIWFKHKLSILNPNSVEPFSKDRGELLAFLDKLLRAADVGICRTELEKEVDISKLGLPDVMVEDINNNLENGDSAFVRDESFDVKKRFVVTKENDKLCAYRLVTVHKNNNGDEIKFELENESDGTRRLIELAPAFFSKKMPDRVLVIDEMDRSLHPAVTVMLHEAHYGNSERTNAQLILATHEHYLLNQEFYRRDEIWFVEKNKYGVSKLYSLNDYDVRKDKDLEKDYLLGRYGATPYIKKLYAQT